MSKSRTQKADYEKNWKGKTIAEINTYIRKLEAVAEDAKNLLDAHDNGKPQYVPEGMDILRASVADLEDGR